MTHCMQCQDGRYPCTCELSVKEHASIGVDISSRLHLRWSDHHANGEYLEVQTVDGWQSVYPLLRKLRKETER